MTDRQATVPEPAEFGWSDAFLLGDPRMDAVHREFVDVVSRLLNCTDAQMLACLDAFIEHARSHFGEEDDWMRESGFPPRDCHIDEHAAVLASAEEVRAQVAAGDHAIGRALAAELVHWFPGHADHLDSALAHWKVKRSHGGKPVVLRRDIGLRAESSAEAGGSRDA